MLINADASTDDDNDKVTEVVRLKGRINNVKVGTQARGSQEMNDWMKPYKKPGSLTEIDVQLLRGIYEKGVEEIHEPDQKLDDIALFLQNQESKESMKFDKPQSNNSTFKKVTVSDNLLAKSQNSSLRVNIIVGNGLNSDRMKESNTLSSHSSRVNFDKKNDKGASVIHSSRSSHRNSKATPKML